MRLYLRDDCNKSTQFQLLDISQYTYIYIFWYKTFISSKRKNSFLALLPWFKGTPKSIYNSNLYSNSLPPPVRVTRHNKAFFEFLQPSRVELAVIYLEDKWGIRKEIEARHSSKDDLKARDETRDASQFPPWEELVARQVRGIHRKELAS